MDIVDENEAADVSFCMAVCLYTGFSMPRHKDDALRYLAIARRDTEHPNIRRWADIFQGVIDQEDAQRRSSTSALAEFDEADRFVQLLHDVPDVRQVLPSMVSGAIAVTEALLNRLWAISCTFAVLGDVRLIPWHELSRYAEGLRVGASPENIRLSENDVGPTYNQNNAHEFPILGAVISSEVQKAHNTFCQTPDAAASAAAALSIPAFGAFRGLRATRSGEINFILDPANDAASSLIFPQDIDVVLALAFGAKEPIWPTFSLNEVPAANGRETALVEKVWNPAWLAHTEFGKTFYGADIWIGRLSWQFENFSFDPTSSFADAAKELLVAIEPRNATEPAGRHEIRPDKIQWSWAKSPEDDLLCEIQGVSMRVDGSQILRDVSGKTNDTYLLNSETMRDGRVANLLTAKFDTLAKTLPMYERLRQLNALLYAVIELRNRGFTLGHELNEGIAHIQGAFRCAVALPISERLVPQT